MFLVGVGTAEVDACSQGVLDGCYDGSVAVAVDPGGVLAQEAGVCVSIERF